jgi:RND family efflux transporter MFP subunit
MRRPLRRAGGSASGSLWARFRLRRLQRALIGATIWAVGCSRAPELPPPPPAKVTVALPVEQEIAEFRDYTGRVEAVETEEVRARVKGFLQKVHLREGAEVKKGALLYEIDPRTFSADLDKVKAEVSRFETQLDLLSTEARRAAELRNARAMSEEEYLQRIAARNAADAGLKQAKAALESAKLELGFTQIRAQIDGKIGRTLVTEGNLVGFNQPTLLTTIVRLDPVYVYFEETERGLEDYDRLVRARGKSIAEAKIPVDVELAWEKGYPHRGHLDFRDNKIDPGSGTIQLRAVIPNPERALTPGQFARVRVTIGPPKKRLLAPEQALGRDQSGKFLLVVNSDNKVEQRTVVTGPAQDGKVVIETGLEPADRIIVSGLQRARPGDVVEPRSTGDR